MDSCALYYIINGEKSDDFNNPNRLHIPRASATVGGVCEILKAAYYPGQPVALGLALDGNVYNSSKPEDAIHPVPVDNPNQVLIVKVAHSNPSLVPTLPHVTNLLKWLEAHGLDSPSIVDVLLRNRVTLEQLKHVKDQDLINMGIREWGSRIALLEAVPRDSIRSGNITQLLLAGGGSGGDAADHGDHPTKKRGRPSHGNGHDGEPAAKKFKRPSAPLTITKIKELDFLCEEPRVPITTGSVVTALDAEQKGFIEYRIKDEGEGEWVVSWEAKDGTHYGNLGAFFKSVTGRKGFSFKHGNWDEIFFQRTPKDEKFTLNEIKFLLEGPKKLTPPYFFFSMEQKRLFPSKPTKVLSEEWKLLSDEARKVYQDLELADRKRYEEHKVLWQVMKERCVKVLGYDPFEGEVPENAAVEEGGEGV